MEKPGDDKAYFSRSVDENLDALYGVALRLTGRPADAEDLVAETAAKAWAAIGSLEDRTRFRPWLFRILRNCYISDYRKRSVRPNEAVYDELADGNADEDVCSMLMNESDDFLNWWSNPEREFFNSMLGDRLVAAMDELPEAYRITVLLVNVEGLTYDEAAEALGVPPGTVRSRMKRGRTMLQKALWAEAIEAGLVIGQGTQ
ncbi:MAG: sigma-70 family RNA polymerase sigma factor [Gammaproteobacteria bacterium]|nr:sigma-70 family RNA polymerase sigma factor [Gammaproteobacteria bacterium]